MAIKAIINNIEKEIEQIKNSNEQDIDYVYSRVGEKEAEGEPTVSIKSIGGELTNYRICGNTVNSESVGDLVTSGDHAGEYCVPVTVEGKNLAKNNYAQSSTWFTVEVVNDFIHVSGTNNTGSAKAYVISRENIFPTGSYDIVNNSNTTIAYDYRDMNDTLVYGFVTANSIKTINFPAVFTRSLNVYKTVPNGESIDNYFQVMIVKHGDDTDTYEPYHAPVTTPIYLPKQIRKVGDEAEYIDYGEQKQHIVRKNLLLYDVKSKTINGVTFRVNNDGSVTCDGTAKNNTWFTLLKNCSIFGECILSGSPFNGSDSRYLIRAYYNNDSVVADYGAGTILNFNNPFTVEIRIASGFTCRNLTFYPMIRKVNIEDDTYEPYIKKTELDIALPALSTVTGTNTFLVNTTIQPSNIYVKDNFDYKRVFTVTRAIEGELPLSYRSIEDNDSALKNYRIYGQTVDGESVGDRTGNLFDEESTKIPGFIDDNGRINTSIGGVSTYDYIECSASTSYYLRAFTKTDPSASTQRVAFFDGNKDFISRKLGSSSFSFTTPENCSFIRLSLDDNYQNIVLMQGSIQPTEFIPYGYKVPVTVEGKNLLQNTATSRTIDGLTFTVNSDGSVTCNGRRESTSTFFTIGSITTFGEMILSGCPSGGSSTSFAMRVYSATISNPMVYYDIGDSCRLNTPDTYSIDIRIQSGYTCDNLTFYPMIRRADISDDTYEPYQPPITTNLYLPEQIHKVGDEAEYVDYKEQKQHFADGTSADVALPALPTLSGTNTLSVGTQVQPSKVMVKGKLKRIIYD